MHSTPPQVTADPFRIVKRIGRLERPEAYGHSLSHARHRAIARLWRAFHREVTR
jgi:hypothetical protein